MLIEPILHEVEAAIEAQLQLAGGEIAAAAPAFLAAFRPSMRQGLVTAVERAAAEVSAQLGDRDVTVGLVDGEPELSVSDPSRGRRHDDDDVEARLTLRLPKQLKDLVEDVTATSGESLNAWVVDAVRSQSARHRAGTRVTDTLDL